MTDFLNDNPTFEQTSILGLVPERLLDESDDIAKLLKAYADFNALENNPSKIIQTFEKKKEIDQAVSHFLDDLHNELGQAFTKRFQADPAGVYRNLARFYEVKGSREAFGFLFRSVFDVDVNVYDTWEQVLKASDGKWVSQQVVTIENSVAFLQQYGKTENPRLSLRNTQAGDVFFLNVQAVSNHSNHIKLFADGSENLSQIIQGSWEVFWTDSEGVERVVDVLTGFDAFEIVEKGSGFSNGQEYVVNVGGVFDGLSFFLSVGQGESGYGSVRGVGVQNPGLGAVEAPVSVVLYSDGGWEILPDSDGEKVSQVDTLTDEFEMFSLMQTYASEDYFAENDYVVPENVQLVGETDTVVAEPIGDSTLGRPHINDYVRVCDELVFDCPQDVGNGPSFEVKDCAWGDERFYDEAYAIVRFFPSNIFTGVPGWFENKDGILSDENVLQDNFRYQRHAYVVASPVSRDDHWPVVHRASHPAGTVMFAERVSEDVVLVENINTSTETETHTLV